jgi:hypothetical protein
LQQLRGELYQRIGYVNNRWDERTEEFASMKKVVYDLSEQCGGIEKFLFLEA